MSKLKNQQRFSVELRKRPHKLRLSMDMTDLEVFTTIFSGILNLVSWPTQWTTKLSWRIQKLDNRPSCVSLLYDSLALPKHLMERWLLLQKVNKMKEAKLLSTFMMSSRKKSLIHWISSRKVFRVWHLLKVENAWSQLELLKKAP